MLDPSSISVILVCSALAVPALVGCTTGSDSGPSSAEGHQDTAEPADGAGTGTAAPGSEGVDTSKIYEAPEGQSCVELGDYVYTVDLVLPDGDPSHCTLGSVNKNLFGDGGESLPPLTASDLEKQECTTTSPCNVTGTRCNWLRTSVGRQDGEGGVKIGDVTTTDGVKVFSTTSFAFYGSEHHVLDDGTEMFPKCSWTIIGKKK